MMTKVQLSVEMVTGQGPARLAFEVKNKHKGNWVLFELMVPALSPEW